MAKGKSLKDLLNKPSKDTRRYIKSLKNLYKISKKELESFINRRPVQRTFIGEDLYNYLPGYQPVAIRLLRSGAHIYYRKKSNPRHLRRVTVAKGVRIIREKEILL